MRINQDAPSVTGHHGGRVALQKQRKFCIQIPVTLSVVIPKTIRKKEHCMEKKKNAEPVTLFSNDTIEIIDDGADYFTKDALMYGLDGTDFPGDIEDV